MKELPVVFVLDDAPHASLAADHAKCLKLSDGLAHHGAGDAIFGCQFLDLESGAAGHISAGNERAESVHDLFVERGNGSAPLCSHRQLLSRSKPCCMRG